MEQLLQMAQQNLQQAHLTDAERALRAILERQPDHLAANRGLALVLNTEGRRWEAAPYLFQLVRLGAFSIEELLLLGIVEETYEDVRLVEAALKSVPDDLVPAIGLARHYRRWNDDTRALDLLKRVVATHPEQVEGQAQLGRLLLDLGRDDAFIRWQADLTSAHHMHPGIWVAEGAWAERHGQPEAAVRCYWEAVRLAPNYRYASYDLGMALTKMKRADLADAFLKRSESLNALVQALHPIYNYGPKVESMQRAGKLLESLGRFWEAWAWQIAILSVDPTNQAAIAARDRLRSLLDRDNPPRTLASANPASTVDLSQYDLPTFARSGNVAQTRQRKEESRGSFVEMAEAAGIAFRYFDSWTAAGRELMLLETTGGGVAVFDFDRDGWPDIYLTQCAPWPLDPEQNSYLDRLYRNLGDGTFRDVTTESGISENGYSQGVAVGDIDNDGFPDLYVGNVGQNHLYHNNGDGTFSAVPHHHDDRIIWTTSVLIADVNTDGLPDIYDVNYVTGDEVYTKHCVIDGRIRSCGPSIFDGEIDALFLNTGNGDWRDATLESGLQDQVGRGLGIAAFDLGGQGRLALLISNDVMGNFLLVNEAAPGEFVPRLTDVGLLSGVATNSEGDAQASMGIAVGDVNQDGLLDLFVANYYKESNSLYMQQPGQLFSDQTREYGLRSPSFLFLAFGSQFLDGDLDGYPDLVVANGHVDDRQYRGEPWYMRPQYFRNVEGRRFEELRSPAAGEFFSREFLGRGLARLDWNRDGREEFVVSNIAAPASLLRNSTEPAGHWLALRLCGVQSARDAVGTRVTLDVAGRTRVRQLFAGDGYEASNQRQLIFGLGTADHVEQMTVIWPTGARQVFPGPPIDCELLAIEGDGQLHRVVLER